MSQAASAREQTVDGTVVTMFLGFGDQILQNLGNRTDGGQTLFQLAAADPTVLKKWSASRGSGPLCQEKRAFAKIAQGLIKGGFVLVTISGRRRSAQRPSPWLSHFWHSRQQN